MTTRGQITKRAEADGVDAKVVERDYVLAHIVGLIAAQDRDRSLVFKGGTSLRLLHFEEYRYSADLDYSMIQGTIEQADAMIRAALSASNLSSISNLSLADDRSRIGYRGPLGAQRTIKLDIAEDELVVNTEGRRPLRRWEDVPDVEVATYTLLEVTGEKLRCVLQRLQCRDLLDLDMLFESGVDPVASAELFARKARHRKKDPATFGDTYRKRIKDYARRWDDELSQYLGEVPDFDTLSRRVARSLKKAKLL